MPFLRIRIMRFTDPAQPGWVEAEFLDADGGRHIVTDKVPVLSTEDLDENSEYPVIGSLACEVIEEFRDKQGRQLLRITTSRPFDVETKEGLTEFTVEADCLTEQPG